MSLSIAIVAHTDVGRVRQINEDAYLVADLAAPAILATDGIPQAIGDRRLLLAVSDGMGGHAAGEVASALVLQSLQATLAAATGEPRQELLDAVVAANAAVRAAAASTAKAGMGATLTAMLAIGERAYIAEVGDSRAYLLRDGTLQQLTRDQSLVQALVDNGALTPEQAEQSPQKNVILQAVGSQPEVTAVITEVELRAGDIFLICCDGLSNEISAEELAVVLRDTELAATATRLIDMANERGGADNVTAIVARIAAA